MFHELEGINSRPEPFEFYTAEELWADEHTSKQMLSFHLNSEIDVSSRRVDFINKSVAWIASYFNVGKAKTIADFGCGPGLYTARLAKLKAHVTGIDFSKRSIDYAKEVANKESLAINYVNQNYLEFDAEQKFDLITMIMCDFCALSPDQRKRLLRKFHSFLRPEGSVLLDVYSLAAYEQKQEAAVYQENLLNGFFSANKYYGFMNTFKYEEEKVALDKFTIIEAAGIKTIYNWLQYFSPESLAAEFTQSGFKIDSLFANVAGEKFDPKGSEFAIVAKMN